MLEVNYFDARRVTMLHVATSVDLPIIFLILPKTPKIRRDGMWNSESREENVLSM